jgi:hypothetical protein
MTEVLCGPQIVQRMFYSMFCSHPNIHACQVELAELRMSFASVDCCSTTMHNQQAA